MKKFALKSTVPFTQNPLILVVGNDSNKNKLIQKLLVQQNYLSKKFGRIFYIGQKQYKSPSIQLDSQNSKKQNNYGQIMDLLDNAKKQNIQNLLFVFNSNQIEKYVDIIEKIMGYRYSYLNGVISFLIVADDVDKISKQIFENATNIFLFQSKYQNMIMKQFGVEKIELKKKKQVLFIGNKIIQKILI